MLRPSTLQDVAVPPHPCSHRNPDPHLCSRRSSPAGCRTSVKSFHSSVVQILSDVLPANMPARARFQHHHKITTCSPPSMRAPSGCNGLVFPVLASAILRPVNQNAQRRSWSVCCGLSSCCWSIHCPITQQQHAAMAQLQPHRSDRWSSSHRLLQSM